MAVIRSGSPERRHHRRVCVDNVLLPDPRPQPTYYNDTLGPRQQHDNEFDDFTKIRILPSTDEILAPYKPTYLPKKNWKESNPIAVGPQRLLDVLFRHLRFENVEKLRDIAYSAAQQAFLSRPGSDSIDDIDEEQQSQSLLRHINSAKQRDMDCEGRFETSAGNRFFLYRGVQIEEILSHEYAGILLRISYDCPRFMRGKAMYNAGRLQEGMLTALLCFNRDTNELRTHFMQAHKAQSTMSMNTIGGRGTRAAVQIEFPPETPADVVEELALLAQKPRPNVRMVLVEFPKVLLAGFYHCLKRLQNIDYFAFQDYLAPCKSIDEIDSESHRHMADGRPAMSPCPPPRYARDPSFLYNLSSLSNGNAVEALQSLTCDQLRNASTLELLRSSTVLDHGQAPAFRDCLLREFALTQGPPGTGKSFLGIQLTKALLASNPEPILVVCLTNHALDNFLAGLEDAGITKLVRIGNGSKEEWTEKIKLHNLRKGARLSKTEKWIKSSLSQNRKALMTDFESWCQSLSHQRRTGHPGWFTIKSVLQDVDPGVLGQFDLYNGVSRVMSFVFDFWMDGGDIGALRTLASGLSSDMLTAVGSGNRQRTDGFDEFADVMTAAATKHDSKVGEKSIWRIPKSERVALAESWFDQADTQYMASFLQERFVMFNENLASSREIRQKLSARLMRQKSVVGITTTACAQHWDMIKLVGFETVICEEAGEVMEPHALCAMLPSIQHAIFIGDPLQLRPELTERSLSLECTMQYRLDESLFERLMMPKDIAASALPMSQLTIQRRMHPSIADIARLTYPYLEDHLSTQIHETTHGIVPRMFWWDHRVPETQDVGVTKSHLNMHEVDMVTSLVRYLLKGNAYSQGDIAVLTPYNGQLAELHKSLKNTCRVWMTERDRELILDEGLLDRNDMVAPVKDEVSMADMLRVATIDNFQGEEAKIVILTTVRSASSPGFLATPNRINVATSRAMNGFYIVGNSDTLQKVPMWQRILQVFGDRRGFGLLTTCDNHPSFRHTAFHPTDFDLIPDCPASCDQTLACGHQCPEACHAQSLHDEDKIPCRQLCEKLLTCGHECLRRCGVNCGTCLVAATDTKLPCDHAGHILCSGELSRCEEPLGVKTLSCGHSHHLVCGDTSGENFECQEPCAGISDCGHPCAGLCSECTKQGHKMCGENCMTTLPCQHECKELCSHHGPCPPCSKAIEYKCEHGSKTKKCSQAQELCMELQPSCQHEEATTTPCCLPKFTLPCSQPCAELLPCGHRCPSLESEICLPSRLCPSCDGKDTSNAMVYVQECGHVVSVEELDERNLQQVYVTDLKGVIIDFGPVRIDTLRAPTCSCGVPCAEVNRYRQIGKLANLPRTFSHLFSKIHRKMSYLARHIDYLDRCLQATLAQLTGNIQQNPLAININNKILLDRGQDLRHLENEIQQYRENVVIPVEAHMRRLSQTWTSIPRYVLLSNVKMETMRHRSVIVEYWDRTKFCKLLFDMDDRSGLLRQQALMFLEATFLRAMQYREACENLLTESSIHTSPRLLTELSLQEMEFWLLAQTAALARGGPSIIEHNIDQVPRFLKTLQEVVRLSKHYPTSNASFLETARKYQEIFMNVEDGTQPPEGTPIDRSGVKQLEMQYDSIGSSARLATCDELHPYAADIFTNGCPECGEYVQSSEEAFTASGKHLREDDFLVAMRQTSLSSGYPIGNQKVEDGQGAVAKVEKEGVHMEDIKAEEEDEGKENQPLEEDVSDGTDVEDLTEEQEFLRVMRARFST